MAVMMPVCLVAIYLLAGWVLGAIPVNRNFKPSANGVDVFVWSNGVHTDLVVPMNTPAMDWRPWIGISNFTYVAMGWGDKQFYLKVAHWKDLTAGVALDALVFKGDPAMHVTGLTQAPATGADCRRIPISQEQYKILAAYLMASFRLDNQGRPVALPVPGYGDTDRFYDATGRYGPVHTCNEWTGTGLRKAGIKTGVWTPFESSVMRHLPKETMDGVQ